MLDFLLGCLPTYEDLDMETRITVASQMFLGLVAVYRDAAVINPAIFAQQALHMADHLIAAEAKPVEGGPAAMPAASSALERDQIRQILESNGDLLEFLRAANVASAGPGSNTLH